MTMNTQRVPALIQSLSQTPNQISKLLDTFPQQLLTQRPSGDEFSFLENVCHLRDLEVEGYTPRINSILNEADPQLLDFDGTRVAFERDYNRQDIVAALNAFAEARQRNVALLGMVDEEQLKRTGELQGVGRVTLDRVLEMMLEHDEGHLEDLARLSQWAKQR